MKRAILIAGPTASGKSGFALDVAARENGVIVNADSMQAYSGLSVLTACPDEAEQRQAPHRLYNHMAPDQRYSTGRWLRDVAPLLVQIEGAGQVPIFVGGTGLYFEALVNGFADVPKIPDEIVQQINGEVEGLDGLARMLLLRERDPVLAGRLSVADRQRTVRALSVLAHTGRALSAWQDDPAAASLLSGYGVQKQVLLPDREVLYGRIDARFAQMMTSGAIAEVEALMALELDPTLPVMKAIGVREIASMLAGDMSAEDVIEKAARDTRRYAKRQMTWARQRMADWDVV